MAEAGPHILVIDDEEAVQVLLERQLTSRGYQVTIAKDGLDGLMKLEELRPSLIICDMMMPNLDGLGFVNAIKGHQGTRDIPVLFLTAKSDTRDMIEGINAGARFYLTKPFLMEELFAKVNKALGK
jgi:DNA-binding response OmpR family regulator